MLSVKTAGNRFYYSLTNARALSNFVGSVPPIAPDWNALGRVVGAIWTSAEWADGFAQDALIVEIHRVARELDDDLAVLDIEGPHRLRGAAILDEWDQWSSDLMVELASGRWPDTDICVNNCDAAIHLDN